jgi:hypothetical protein
LPQLQHAAQAHLPQLVPFLLAQMRDPCPQLRVMSCWCASRYVEWIAEQPPEVSALCRAVNRLLICPSSQTCRLMLALCVMPGIGCECFCKARCGSDLKLNWRRVSQPGGGPANLPASDPSKQCHAHAVSSSVVIGEIDENSHYNKDSNCEVVRMLKLYKVRGGLGWHSAVCARHALFTSPIQARCPLPLRWRSCPVLRATAPPAVVAGAALLLRLCRHAARLFAQHYFAPLARVLVERVLDRNKKVQEAACSALCTVFDQALPQVRYISPPMHETQAQKLSQLE